MIRCQRIPLTDEEKQKLSVGDKAWNAMVQQVVAPRGYLDDLRELRAFVAGLPWFDEDSGARVLQFIDRRWPGVAPK